MHDKKKIILKTIGVDLESDLDINYPIVYKGNSLISSMSYSGDADKILESTTIDDFFKEKLSKMNVKVSLGLADKKLKNAHIYCNDAVHLDGRGRICYIQQEYDYLLISEFHGNRGAKYSSLYKELSSRLKENRFEVMDGKFKVPRNKIDLFISIVNELVEDKEKGSLKFEVINDVDSISIKGKKYYYYKAYWIKENAKISYKENSSNNDSYSTIKNSLKTMADYIINCNEIENLDELSEKMASINRLILNRKQALNDAKIFD